MNPTIERLKLAFLAVFAALVVGVVVWQVGWAMPQKKCEQAHKWWDHGQRVCAQPVLISDITGKTIQDKQAEAAAKAAIGRTEAPAAK
jgi:hypothetical protein